MKEEEHRAIARLLFLGKGDGGAATPSFNCLSNLVWSICRVKRNGHKYDDKNSLRTF